MTIAHGWYTLGRIYKRLHLVAKDLLKTWTSRINEMTTERYFQWLDSYWHKSETIPIETIGNLQQMLDGKASVIHFNSHLTDPNAHTELFAKKVDRVDGKGLSANDFTNELKAKLEGLTNVELDSYLQKGTYTGTAQDLKNDIQNLVTLLRSDDVDLNTLQEIVDFIKLNKATLAALGISNIAGLQSALDNKAAKEHNHLDTHHTKSEVQSLIDGVKSILDTKHTKGTTKKILLDDGTLIEQSELLPKDEILDYDVSKITDLNYNLGLKNGKYKAVIGGKLSIIKVENKVDGDKSGQPIIQKQELEYHPSFPRIRWIYVNPSSGVKVWNDRGLWMEYASTHYVTTQLTNKADKTQLEPLATKEEVKKAVDDLDIGVRNLLKNTLYPTLTNWTHSPNTQIELGQIDFLGRTDAFRLKANDNEDFSFSTLSNQTYAIKEKGIYTLSFYVKANNPIMLPIFLSGVRKDTNVTTEWSKVVMTYDIASPSTYKDIEFAGNNLLKNNNGLELYLSHIKLERGDKATDWLPAPEDIFYRSQYTFTNPNLLLRSNIFNKGSVPADNKIVPSITPEGYLKVEVQAGNSNWHSLWGNGQGLEDRFKEGEDFTVSIWIKSDPGATGKPLLHLKEGMSYTRLNGEVSTQDFTQLYYTGKWKKANLLSFHLGWRDAVGTFYIKQWKIEKGFSPTSWLPNVEDELLRGQDNSFVLGDNSFVKNDNVFTLRPRRSHTELNTLNLPSGTHPIETTGGTGTLTVFKSQGSVSSIELFKKDWNTNTRLGVRHTVDGTRFDNNGEFKELAWYDDVTKVVLSSNTHYLLTSAYLQNIEQHNKVVMMTHGGSLCTVAIDSPDGFVATYIKASSADIQFSGNGKPLIQVNGTDTISGAEGSSATVIVFNNKVYLRVSNI